MKETLNSFDYHCAISGCREYLKNLEPKKIYSYFGESLADFYNRMPREYAWQIGWDFRIKGRWFAEEVLGPDGNPKELQAKQEPLKIHAHGHY